jgi:aminopeptidase N
MAIPVVLGLVAPDGQTLPATSEQVRADGVFVLETRSASVTFSSVTMAPVPSLFRGFSAPVKVSLDLSTEQLLALLRHDTDPFNRWQASQTVAMRYLVRRSREPEAEFPDGESLASALRAFTTADALRDPAFAALVLTLPSEADIAQEIGADVDPDAVHEARRALRRGIGERCFDRLQSVRKDLTSSASYTPDAASAGRRALANGALDLIAAADPLLGERLAATQVESATNMTDRLAAFAVLTTIPGEAREHAIAAFGERFSDEPLVLDKWFALQAAIPEAGTLDRVKALMGHPAFSMTNPNRIHSLIGSFAMANPSQFNRADASGYEFLADIVLELDGSNPQVAARLLTAFGPWRMMEKTRRAGAEHALRRIAEKPSLSRDVGDIVQRSLAREG